MIDFPYKYNPSPQKRSYGLYQVIFAVLFSLSIFFLPVKNLCALQVIDIQRGVHKNYDLLVIYCDSIAEFNLAYDRVGGTCELRIIDGVISQKAVKSAGWLKPGAAVRGIKVDPEEGLISLNTNDPVYIRQYIVNGPPALLLDLSRVKSFEGVLPFELDRKAYLNRGNDAERRGKLETALGYISHVNQAGSGEPLLVHRAGVIRHKLGRWDEALRDFDNTEGIGEFAADAHARRAMIYLAVGDTAKSGRAWEKFFHDKPMETGSWEGDLTMADLSERNGSSDERKRFFDISRKSFPRIVKAGGDRAIMLGWGLLIIGLTTLIGLIINSGKAILPYSSYSETGYLDSSLNSDYISSPAAARVSIPNAAAVGQRLRGNRPSGSAMKEGVAQVVQRYEMNSLEDKKLGQTAPVRKPMTKRSIPTEEILKLAGSGRSEIEIARRLNMGRDEVSMVLNLNRLSKGA